MLAFKKGYKWNTPSLFLHNSIISLKKKKMATEELVTEQFQFLGIDVTGDVLSKCVHLCEEYQVDAETFVEQWMAFSLTHLNGSAPNLENVELLARKEFSKRAAVRSNASIAGNARPATGPSVKVYGWKNSAQPDEEVITNYITGTPKRVKLETESPQNQNELHPATYSPTINHSAKFASRQNAGAVLHSYGDEVLLQQIDKPLNPQDELSLNITQVPNDDGDLYNKSMFGFELLHEKATTFADHISYISQCIMKKAGLADATSVRHKTQTEVIVAGRIECDADARLNPKSVVLQGTWEESLSQAVSVDIDNLKQYSLFPGQVVVMRGVNPRGDRFEASQVYSDAALPIPDAKADIIHALSGTMSLVVASGPFTTSDNLYYEPLQELISYVSAHRPHVVILTGPFLDCEHSMVKDNSMAETFTAFFEKLIDRLAEINTSSPYTKIYVVSSHRDAFHVNIYPTPPYSSRRRLQNVYFLPDPSTINISGVVVTVTSTDVLMYISQEEISLGMCGDKLARLAGHVVQQQSMLPLCPAPPTLAVDAALSAAHAHLTHTPHLLVTPSNFRYFVKDLNGCVVVNPEHLTKGNGGGTFARLLIAGDKEIPKIAAQILRI